MTAMLLTITNEDARHAANTTSAPTMPEGTSQTQHDQCTTDAPTGQTPRAKLVPKTNPGRVADHIREAYRIVDGLWRSSQRAGGDYAWLDLNGIRLCVRAEGGQPALVLWYGPANLRKWRGMYEAAWGLAFTAAHYEREQAAPVEIAPEPRIVVDWLPEHDHLITVGPERGFAHDCPVCLGWGELEDIRDHERVDCSVCDGTGARRGSTLYQTRARLRAQAATAAERMTIEF